MLKHIYISQAIFLTSTSNLKLRVLKYYKNPHAKINYCSFDREHELRTGGLKRENWRPKVGTLTRSSLSTDRIFEYKHCRFSCNKKNNATVRE